MHRQRDDCWKHAIELAVKNEIVEEKCVKKIGKVPFAYVFAI